MSNDDEWYDEDGHVKIRSAGGQADPKLDSTVKIALVQRIPDRQGYGLDLMWYNHFFVYVLTNCQGNSMDKKQLMEKIEKYIAENGGTLKDYGWYAGITNDAERRLFTEHKVNKRDGAWIYGTADSVAAAKEIEGALLQQGCQGGSGGGTAGSRVVYAYRITFHTQE